VKVSPEQANSTSQVPSVGFRTYDFPERLARPRVFLARFGPGTAPGIEASITKALTVDRPFALTTRSTFQCPRRRNSKRFSTCAVGLVY
jgi:hypothetical protein